MATHCSTIAWKIPWTEEPGRLQSMGSQRVGHDWATSLSLNPKYFLLTSKILILSMWSYKVHTVKHMVFPVIMYWCESWTIKKTECQRMGAFELGCWWRLLRVPWTARRSNQSILKEINPKYSLKGLMLKLQYYGRLMWKANSLEKTLMLGKIEDRDRRGQQRMRWLHGITD